MFGMPATPGISGWLGVACYPECSEAKDSNAPHEHDCRSDGLGDACARGLNDSDSRYKQDDQTS